MPYVSASGDYDINLLIPGCTNLQDCPLRTSVKVTVLPGGGLPPVVTTVRQDVPTDMTTGIYTGPIFPAGPNFQTSIMMQLADQPVGSGQGGKFELVADRVDLVLTSVNTTGVTGTGINGSVNTASVNRGFGFFEWNLSGQGNVDATGVIPNSSETSNDALGLQLFSALGNNTSTNVPFIVNDIATHSSGTIFVGGNFTLASGPANIVAFKGNSLTGLAGGGLNGPVNALGIVGNTLYVGGAFLDTPSGTGSGAFRGVVQYDIQNDKWNALLAGVNGAVTDINLAQNKVNVVGNFTQLPTSPNSASGAPAVGFATWDIGNGTWVSTGGFVTGSMAFVANGTGSEAEFLAGSVTSSRTFGADGFAMISNGRQANGDPAINPLNVQLDSTAVSTAVTPQRRSFRRSSWLGSISLPHLFSRQTSNQPSALPASPPAPAPAVLAGTFWTNSSSTAQTVILGGNFSFPSGASTAQSVAFYDAARATVIGVRGAQINGTVQALQVSSNNTLAIGGQFTLAGSQGTGLAMYDLVQQQWDTSFQGLQGMLPHICSF
jgi:Rax2 C-terminal beta propeller domain/Rax2 third domain